MKSHRHALFAMTTPAAPKPSLPRAVLLAALLGLAPHALADEQAMLRLLKVLRDQGTITAAQYEELRLAAEADKKGPATTPPTEPKPAAATPANAAATPSQPSPAAGAPRASGAPSVTAAAAPGQPSIPAVAKATPKWSDRLSIRGYVQLRYNAILDESGPGLNVPNDRSVSRTDSFMLRRGRLILSGDVSDHVFVYVQPDMNATPTDGQFSVQLRDIYADVAFDKAKEYRVRLGQSKVPYGFVNMQSSQNRAPLERPDAINSAVEGERDIGAFFYWAPAEVRERFRTLVSSGLKGSGDYGVVGLGIYSGQGLNRSDRNGDLHAIARVSYPFALPGGQVFEPGLQAYTGRFVVDTVAVTSPSGATIRPTARADGIADERVAATLVWYPKPIGFEAEWTIGRGPELGSNFSRIESGFLHGGYVQAHYLMPVGKGSLFPFVRWQMYEGGRKFARNAPSARVNEIDFGIEWSPWKEIEVAVAYTHTFHRTNTSIAPYADAEGSDRIGMQVQWNY
jgi:hypothetical protein